MELTVWFGIVVLVLQVLTLRELFEQDNKITRLMNCVDLLNSRVAVGKNVLDNCQKYLEDISGEIVSSDADARIHEVLNRLAAIESGMDRLRREALTIPMHASRGTSIRGVGTGTPPPLDPSSPYYNPGVIMMSGGWAPAQAPTGQDSFTTSPDPVRGYQFTASATTADCSSQKQAAPM